MHLSAIKQTAMYAISAALMRGVSLLMLPIVTGYLPTEDFGRLEIISSLAVLASVVAGLGMEDALYRFVGQSKTETQRKSSAANIFTLTLLIAIFLAAINYPLSYALISYLPGEISAYAMHLLLLTLAMEGVIAVPLGWLRMQDRAITFCTLSVMRVGIQSSLVYALLLGGRGVEGVLEASLIAALIQGLCLSWIQIKETGLRLNPQLFSKTFIYSVPLVGSGLLAFGLNGLDRWLIGESLNLEAVALYGVAAKFSIAMVLLIQPFSMWWMPRRFTELNKPDGTTRSVHYATMGIVILIFMAFTVGLFAPYLMNFILPSHYSNASNYLLGLLLFVALREASEFINIGCFIHDKTNIQLWINLVATLIGCIAMWLTINHFGVWGVIFALVFAQVARLALFFYYSQKHLPLDFKLIKLTSLSAYVAIVLALNSWIMNSGLFQPKDILMVLLCILVVSIRVFLSLSSHLKLLPHWKLQDVFLLAKILPNKRLFSKL